MISQQQRLIFKLNENEQFIIQLHEPIDIIYPCELVTIEYVGEKTFGITQDCLFVIMNELSFHLDAVLRNKYQLHESINKNIGYLWNEELHGVELPEEEGDWVGEKYLLWSTAGKIRPRVDVWVYNDSAGKIILEITPNYPWHFEDPESANEYITYEEFMRTYKPILKRVISFEIAKEWAAQAKFFTEFLHARLNSTLVNNKNETL